jgi:hypothetical protein
MTNGDEGMSNGFDPDEEDEFSSADYEGDEEYDPDDEDEAWDDDEDER